MEPLKFLASFISERIERQPEGIDTWRSLALALADALAQAEQMGVEKGMEMALTMEQMGNNGIPPLQH